MYQGMESRESNVQEPSAASLKVSMSSHVMLPVYLQRKIQLVSLYLNVHTLFILLIPTLTLTVSVLI